MVRPEISAVVFDVGGVLVDWNPEYLYRDLIPDPVERASFLTQVCSPRWNHRLDEGGSVQEAVASLAERHPDKADLINAWWERWPEMLGGEVPGTRALLESLAATGPPIYALTNWAAETWPRGREVFPFLDEVFDGIVVSGHELVAKPDPRIFEILSERFGLDPSTTVFIDDSAPNVESAQALGFIAHRFESAGQLEAWLRRLGLLPGA